MWWPCCRRRKRDVANSKVSRQKAPDRGFANLFSRIFSASVARMSEAISGSSLAENPACRYAHAGYLLCESFSVNILCQRVLEHQRLQTEARNVLIYRRKSAPTNLLTTPTRLHIGANIPLAQGTSAGDAG
jgi:hypothetical protein